MKKAFVVLPVSLFAVFTLASCGGNAGYSDSYENYLASVDATALSKNFTMTEKSGTEYYSEYMRIGYTYYQLDSDSLDDDSRVTAYYGYVMTDGKTYSYEGTSMANLEYESDDNLSKESAAISIHKNLLMSISYDLISSSSFYKALTYKEDGSYTFEDYMDYEEGSITLKDGYISHLYLKSDDTKLDIAFSDYGTTVAKTVTLPEE